MPSYPSEVALVGALKCRFFSSWPLVLDDRCRGGGILQAREARDKDLGKHAAALEGRDPAYVETEALTAALRVLHCV